MMITDHRFSHKVQQTADRLQISQERKEIFAAEIENSMLRSIFSVVLVASQVEAFSPLLLPTHNQAHRGTKASPLAATVVTTNTARTDEEILASPMFIDVTTTKSSLSLDDMILIAKRFLVGSNGLGGDPDMLADNFAFEGPVVGPLLKKEFVQAIGSVDFGAAFPGWRAEFYGFHVDPFENDRVWYTARGRGVNKGPLLPFVPEKQRTGREVVNPPQVCSITIDPASGLITRYTIGYVVDRAIGNTGGLGGLYGILYALGRPLPFPEANPWKKSFQYDLFQKVGGLLSSLSNSK
jgi:hypothetical protein